jgi:signal transduction histidine kinase
MKSIRMFRDGLRVAGGKGVIGADAVVNGLSSYPFVMAEPQRKWTHRPQIGASLIALFLVVLAAMTMVVPAENVTAHNILHHLTFLPLMIAGMLFGWRGALWAAFFAGVVNAPVIGRSWVHWPLDAKDQIVELSIFGAAGLIAGYLSDRERMQRRKLETTRQELEGVYLELRENIEAMKKAERLSAAGQLAASLAHEIRNPLASISGAAGILQRQSAPPEYLQDSLEIIQKESQRLNKLLTGFLNFANPRSPRMQRTNLDELLASVISLASHKAEESHIRLTHRREAMEEEVACDPEQLKQVLLNLVINAIEASPAGSEMRLATSMNNGKAIIEVEDHGSGITEEAAARIFDPFFTTKPKGTGLGLAISSKIVSQHNATLSFHGNASGGTTFRIELPVGQETSSAC